MTPPRHDHDAGGDPAGTVVATTVHPVHALPVVEWPEPTADEIAAIPVLARMSAANERR